MRCNPDSRQRTLALTVTCAILFVLANIYPIVTLESQGLRLSCSLPEAVQVLWRSDMEFISVLVLTTALLVPGLEIGLILTVLLQRFPTPLLLRLIEVSRPWAMVDVFVLGLLVSIKKLSDMATIVPGPALWSFCALMVLTASVRATFQLRDFWRQTSVTYAARPS